MRCLIALFPACADSGIHIFWSETRKCLIEVALSRRAALVGASFPVFFIGAAVSGSCRVSPMKKAGTYEAGERSEGWQLR